MNFFLTNDHIKSQLSSTCFKNAMNITSFLTDGIIFSDGYNLPNNVWKEQWFKYCNMIMFDAGYDIEYINPYKSEKLKNVTEYYITKYHNGVLVDVANDSSSSKLSAIVQSFIKISQYSNFYKQQRRFSEIEPILNKFIPDYISPSFTTHNKVTIQDLVYDLRKIINNKTFIRDYKLSLIMKKN